jgi:hypothetical protein
MKTIILVISLFVVSSLHASQVVDVDRLVDKCIYRAEGGANATYLYGIKSISYASPEEARRICRNTVVKNIARWEKAGCPKTFIEFLGSRYCPLKEKKILGVVVSRDTEGHDRWVKNVTRFYANS